MARVKVSEATGPVLDWMVAKADGQEKYITFDFDLTHPLIISGIQSYGPSFIWSQGGPIIEREKISIRYWINMPLVHAYMPNDDAEWEEGPTSLIAAMRCFVSSKLGAEADVPDELIHGRPAPP